jgi:hypothetical protein
MQVPFQLQEQGKCNQEIVQTFPTPADGSSFGVGRGMMIFTSVPANHVKNSKFIKFIKNTTEHFQVNKVRKVMEASVCVY